MATTTGSPVAASERWDEIVVKWPGDSPQQWRRQSDAVNRQLIERWLPGRFANLLKTDLFDEFAGEGLYRCLAGRAHRVTGIDVSPELVARVQARHPDLKAVTADVRQLPFPDASFEAVLSNSTLDHFSDAEQVTRAFAELARVLRPGGRLLVTLDNPVNPLIAVRNLLPRRLARRVRQVPFEAGWTCGPRRLRRLLDATGFEVTATTAVLHAPRALLALLDRPGINGRTLVTGALAMERLERWPTRYLTGHYVAAVATRTRS
jgi:SAM-dependent methyltransferase